MGLPMQYRLLSTAGLLVGAVALPSLHAQTPPERNLVVSAVPTSRPAVAAQQRIALVIGNNAYKDAPLTNPVNDARAMAQALQASGFTVILRTDVNLRDMNVAIREFGDRLRGGGTGLFYFAGHGMQIKGRNYLVPVGADIQREDEVAFNGLDAQAVLDKMEAAGNANNIMILDACRNNPFARSFRSAQQGLAQMDAPVGTMVAFSTAPGSVASDGTGQNGLYTQHLLEAMRRPGLKAEDVFKQVRANVRRDSQGKQVPWEATSMEGDFYFAGAPAGVSGSAGAAAALTPQAMAAAVEDAFWDAVKGASQPVDVRAYLSRYPQGRHVQAARDRLAALERPTAMAAAPLPTPGLSSSTVAPPRPAAQTAPATVSALSTETADEARRRQEREQQIASWAASVAAQRPAAQAVSTSATAQPVSMRPAPASNANGFTVGDRWRYQVVDKWKGEVVSNWERRVASVLPNGDWQTAGGSVFDAWGRPKITVNQALNTRRETTPHETSWPEVMKAGVAETFSNRSAIRDADGSQREVERRISTSVGPLERVRVPAGEFDAHRIEHNFSGTSRNSRGESGYFTGKFIVWYAPSVRGMIANETETRDSRGTIVERTREELTSYQLFGASAVATR